MVNSKLDLQNKAEFMLKEAEFKYEETGEYYLAARIGELRNIITTLMNMKKPDNIKAIIRYNHDLTEMRIRLQKLWDDPKSTGNHPNYYLVL